MPSRIAKGESGFNAVYGEYKRHAKQKSRDFLLTKEQFKDITSKSCSYCGAPPHTTMYSRHKRMSEEGKLYSQYIYTGIDRVDNSQGYTLDNCVPCCVICNRMKLTLSREDFINHITQIVMTQQERKYPCTY